MRHRRVRRTAAFLAAVIAPPAARRLRREGRRGGATAAATAGLPPRSSRHRAARDRARLRPRELQPPDAGRQPVDAASPREAVRVRGARANRGQGRGPHQVITTVTDLTKVIDGVRRSSSGSATSTRAGCARASSRSRPRTTTATSGTSASTPRSGPAAGSTGRRTRGSPGSPARSGGIMMRAAPRPGTSSYRQGFAPTIEFADRAKVLRTGLRDCVPLRCFTHVLLTDETNPTSRPTATSASSTRRASGRSARRRSAAASRRCSCSRGSIRLGPGRARDRAAARAAHRQARLHGEPAGLRPDAAGRAGPRRAVAGRRALRPPRPGRACPAHRGAGTRRLSAPAGSG